MESQRKVGLIGLALVTAAIAVVLITGGGDSDAPETPAATTTATTATTTEEEPGATEQATPPPPPRPEQTRIRVRGGEPVGGVERIEAKKGEIVRLVVTSDVADHVHVHGYDEFQDVGPGRTARFRIEADLEGIFEIELEERGVEIGELRVEP